MDFRCIEQLQLLSSDMIDHANSGHPGAALGCAAMMHVLYSRKHIRFCAQSPLWKDRDFLILSNGHCCALLYATLHLLGYDISIDDLRAFRTTNSKTPGHPEVGVTPGVELTTGPLGQGIASAVGIALVAQHAYARGIAERLQNIYVICGDGCLMEGVASEACSLAGHLRLSNLIVLYDSNNITIDGNTAICYTESTLARFRSYGWDVISVKEGNTDVNRLDEAIRSAKRNSNPTIIEVVTQIGYGSSKAGSAKVHGAPLGKSITQEMRSKSICMSDKPFDIDPEVKNHYMQLSILLDECEDIIENIPSYFEGRIDVDSKEIFKTIASRDSGRIILNKWAYESPYLIGGSADLNTSTKTYLTGMGDFQSTNRTGRNIFFGVREHAMAAICNGICAYGCTFRPFCATFLNFITYCLPSVRISAISKHPVVYIMTHDSICLGEDGATHQPIETLSLLRSIPNLNVYRPGDHREVLGVYEHIKNLTNTPCVVCLSREKIPMIEGTYAHLVRLGGYIVHKFDNKSKKTISILSTGSDLHRSLAVAKYLGFVNVKCISVPCIELLEQQTKEYIEELIRSDASFSIESGATICWYKWVQYPIGIDRFGTSGTGNSVLEYHEMSVTQLRKRMTKTLFNLAFCSFFDLVKSRHVISLDTADIDEIRSFCPTDVTTNPSLINHNISKYAMSWVKTKSNNPYDQIMWMNVYIAKEILKHIPGRVSIEVDPNLAYDTDRTLNAVYSLCEALIDQEIDYKNKVLIKIPATREGIAAAQILESRSIHVNMTLVFSVEQALDCAAVHSTLVSPFVGRISDWYASNDLSVQSHQGIALVHSIEKEFGAHGYKCSVMPASLRTLREIESLQQSCIMTIPPKLARQCEQMYDHVDPHQIDDYIPNGKMSDTKLEEGLLKFQHDFNTTLAKLSV